MTQVRLLIATLVAAFALTACGEKAAEAPKSDTAAPATSSSTSTAPATPAATPSAPATPAATPTAPK